MIVVVTAAVRTNVKCNWRVCAVGYLEPGEKPVGLRFQVHLFAPLRRAISIASRIFEFSESTAWLLCLDEAEFLEDDHQRILNSHMRAHSGNLFFKITTMPYAHRGSETTTRVALDAGHDFDYVYLDSDPVFHAKTKTERGRIGTQFARQVFGKRAEALWAPIFGCVDYGFTGIIRIARSEIGGLVFRLSKYLPAPTIRLR